MKVIFAGTPAFALPSLAKLLDDGHTIAMVLTQPDKPAGRKMALQASDIKKFALAHHLPLAEPRSLRLDGRYPDDANTVRSQIENLQPDVLVVVAYGLLIPEWLLNLPKHGGVNVHPSLPPRWRGASPIQSAILAGDDVTGVCIMQMEAGLDTGAVYLTQSIPLLPTENSGTLHQKLSHLGAELLSQTLRNWSQLLPQPQSKKGVVYAPKIDKTTSQINWTSPAMKLNNMIRAYNPKPGAYTYLRGQLVKIWVAQVGDDSYNLSKDSTRPGSKAGTIVDIQSRGISVATLDGELLIQEFQRSGGKRVSAQEFASGMRLALGEAFEYLL